MAKKNNQRDHLKTPFRAYKGNDPYIFVSYAHVDANRVFPELIRFYNQGYNIWYDQGISPGSEWPEEIEEALIKSSLFVVFVSPHAVESQNVRNEIHLALSEKIPFIAIFLEDTELKYGLRLSMGSIQGILKHSMSEEEYVFKYTNAFKREGGFEPSPKSKSELLEDIDEVLVPKDNSEYVFASYDKKDEEVVLPELKMLRSQGLNIKCINFDNEWSEDTEKKILNSSLFLVYITSNSINSLIVRDEISLAHLEDIPFLVIYLEDVELKYGLRLQMASKESIFKYDLSEAEYNDRYAYSIRRHGFELKDIEASDSSDENYIYASFDIKDKKEALSQIERFTNSGLNIAYDTSGGENEENIDNLLNASLFLVFITPNSIRSNVVRDEIYLALSADIPFIAIHLSETKITTGLKRQLDSKLTIHKYMLDENEYTEKYSDAFAQYGFELSEESQDVPSAKKSDERLTSEYLKEFESLNRTTESIFELESHNVLLILKDGTNLTSWKDVKNKEDIIYVSENLARKRNLKEKYAGLKSLKGIVTPKTNKKITNIESIFDSCESLVEISCLKEWDTSNVTSMRSTFAGCGSLSDFAPITEWETSNVETMDEMFRNCGALTDLSPLDGWDISQLKSKADIFEGCKSLKEYPKWYKKEKNLDDKRLTSKYLKEFEKLNTTTESIFDLEGNNVLIILKDGTNFTSWEDVQNKEDIIYVSENLARKRNLKEKYAGLKSLKGIVTPKINKKITNMSRMFDGCTSLTDISSLQNWNTQQVTTMSGMFRGCTTLTDISSLQNWNINKDITLSYMFDSCTSLSDITSLENWNTSKVTLMNRMFRGCTSLVDLSPLSNWDISKADKTDIFLNCKSIKAYPTWYEKDKTTASNKPQSESTKTTTDKKSSKTKKIKEKKA